MTYPEYLTRRRSPQWVREWTSPTLHSMAGMLNRLACSQDLSAGQERLWDAVIAELEYRHRRAIRLHNRVCWCDLCVPPFPEDREPASSGARDEL